METRNLIGGQWVGAASNQTFVVENPATGEELAKCPDGDGEQAKKAIAAAEGAFKSWRNTTAGERAGLLRKFSAVMKQRVDELANIMTAEQGKHWPSQKGRLATRPRFGFCGRGSRTGFTARRFRRRRPTRRVMVLKQPVGVTAAITPWNFPAAMITRKLGPALAAGCTMVIKPAEHTPLSAIALGQVATEVGFPAGVVNVITGDSKSIGKELLSNPAVRKLSFTGSTAVGKILIKQSAENMTRLSLELGGHAPFLVFDDADIDLAVKGAMASKFRNMGQTCICANRFYVQAGVHDEFVAKLAAAAEKLKVGNGADDGVAVGPLINDEAVKKVREHVEDALAHGARLRTGGKTVKPGPKLLDRFFAPTVLEGMNRDMKISREETFGPVAPVQKFHKEEDAIAWANDSEFAWRRIFTHATPPGSGGSPTARVRHRRRQ